VTSRKTDCMRSQIVTSKMDMTAGGGLYDYK
jgi:hypothetical protein